uniref:Pancreatic trypsin inhibitor n=1 Tax=Rhipicephalus appendiculatus TaxID=34631 RepID=A0A131Z4P3_RHIAP
MALEETIEAHINCRYFLRCHEFTLFVCCLFVARFTATSAHPDITDKCSEDWKKFPTVDKGYYYNKASDTCVSYTKNGQNAIYPHIFPSEEQCNWECRTNKICKLSLDVGTECREKPGELAYHFNDTSKECDLFFYKGCNGNANRFGSVRECEVICRGMRCDQPPKHDDDICYDKRVTYHFRGYNGVSSCVKKPNGCHRSGHNFKKEGDCRRVCILRPDASPSITQSR